MHFCRLAVKITKLHRKIAGFVFLLLLIFANIFDMLDFQSGFLDCVCLFALGDSQISRFRDAPGAGAARRTLRSQLEPSPTHQQSNN